LKKAYYSDGTSATVIVNNSNSSCQVDKSMELGYVSEAEVQVVDCTEQESVLTQQLIPATTGLSVDGNNCQMN